MNNTSTPLLSVLPEFDRIVPPISKFESSYLVKELVNNPELRTIKTWNGYHLTDQYKYDLCRSLNLSVELQTLIFDDKTEAALFICKNELRNPHLTDEYKKYIIGQYLDYKMAYSEKKNNGSMKYSTAADIAHELYISSGTVLKYNLYSSAMNTIFDADFEFGRIILLSQIKVSHENVVELSHLRPEEIRSVAKAAKEDSIDHITLPFIRNEVKWSHVQIRNPLSPQPQLPERKAEPSPRIRQMPVYDPDSEVNSLCMTIDSWVSSIQRVHSSENFNKITSKASIRLIKKLTYLEHTIHTMQDTLVERTDI